MSGMSSFILVDEVCGLKYNQGDKKQIFGMIPNIIAFAISLAFPYYLKWEVPDNVTACGGSACHAEYNPGSITG